MSEIMTIKDFMDISRERSGKKIGLKDSIFFSALIAILLIVTILSGIANPVTLPAYLTL